MSALIGTPPLNDNDYLIAKGLLIRAGTLNPALFKLDPAKGASLPPKRPPPDQYVSVARTTNVVVGSAICMAVILIITGVRLYIRSRNATLRFGKDDWMILPAVALAVTWPALQIANASVGGAGKHIYDLTYQEAANFFYIGSFSTWIFYVAVALIKISILLFYMRLSGFCSRNWNIAHWTMIVIMALFAATAFFLSIFACRPIYASFNIKKIGRTLGPENPPKCLDVADRVTAFSVIHVVSDFALLVVPVMMLKNVQVKTRVKLKVWSVGIIGCASCICSCFRAVVQYRLAATDVTWHYWDLYIWTITDLTTGACAASLPVLSVFVTRVIDQWNRLTGKEVKGSKTLTPTMKNKRAKEAIKTHNKFLKHVNRKVKKQGDTFEDSLELTGSSRAEEKALEGTTDVESGMLSPGGGGGGMASGLGGVGSPIGMASPAPQSRAGEGDLKGDGDERGVFTTRHRVESECLKSRDREDLEKGGVFGLEDAEREMRREEEEERRDGTKGVYTGHGSVGQAL